LFFRPAGPGLGSAARALCCSLDDEWLERSEDMVIYEEGSQHAWLEALYDDLCMNCWSNMEGLGLLLLTSRVGLASAVSPLAEKGDSRESTTTVNCAMGASR
jgi:hypothetical protein